MGASADPAPAQRVAILLHGRIGLWKVKASHIDDPKVVWMANAPQLWKQAPSSMSKIDLPGAPHSTLAGFAAFGRGSLEQHVVQPNQRAGLQIDCFLHSWHVEIGKQLDAMYHPIASQHDPVRKELKPVQSQHLSIKIVLGLANSHAAAQVSQGRGGGGGGGGGGESRASRFGRSLGARGGKGGRASRSGKGMPIDGHGGRGSGGGRRRIAREPATAAAGGSSSAAAVPAYYDLYMVTRYDVLFFTPLQLAPLTAAPLWLPHWCHRYPLNAESGMLVRAACGNWPGRGEGYLVHPATTVGVFPPARGKLTREADFDYAYLDWWFVATPAVASTFSAIYDEYEQYKQALMKVGPVLPLWTHFFWGHHINKRLHMRQTVRFILYEGVDFRLARHWAFGTHCMHHLGGGGGSSALTALASSGVDLGVYFRRTDARRHVEGRAGHPSSPSPLLVNGSLRPGAQPARQCPVDSRVRLYCPWLSPVCPPSTREAVLEVEAAARMALAASTRLPPWDLFGDPNDIEQARQETTRRRWAGGIANHVGAMLNRTRMAKMWALT